MAVTSFAFLRIPALALAACAAQASPLPPHYHAEAVQPGWHDTSLYSVNENGVAAGYWGSAVSQAAVWQDGALRTLDCESEGSRFSGASALNDALQVVGWCDGSVAGRYAVIWDAAGKPKHIRDGAIEADTAAGINNKGQVVGTEGRSGVYDAGTVFRSNKVS